MPDRSPPRSLDSIPDTEWLGTAEVADFVGATLNAVSKRRERHTDGLAWERRAGRSMIRAGALRAHLTKPAAPVPKPVAIAPAAPPVRPDVLPDAILLDIQSIAQAIGLLAIEKIWRARAPVAVVARPASPEVTSGGAPVRVTEAEGLSPERPSEEQPINTSAGGVEQEPPARRANGTNGTKANGASTSVETSRSEDRSRERSSAPASSAKSGTTFEAVTVEISPGHPRVVSRLAEAADLLIHHWPPEAKDCAARRRAMLAAKAALAGTLRPQDARAALIEACREARLSVQP